MPKHIAIIQGHPDPAGGHLGHALATAYATGAASRGHEVRTIDVAKLDFPLLRSQRQHTQEPLPPALEEPQRIIRWADHLVLFFPLWLGDMPALLKGFLEQIAREGFAFAKPDPAHGDGMARKLLTGRSARVVVTMGMPAAIYRHYYRAHSVKSLERNILGFMGIGPIDETLIGQVEQLDDPAKAKLFAQMRKLGREAA
jgi:putative NADPH-quinone reductase